jgi:hypothetical protein
MAMIAITTSSSIRVKPLVIGRFFMDEFGMCGFCRGWL